MYSWYLLFRQEICIAHTYHRNGRGTTVWFKDKFSSALPSLDFVPKLISLDIKYLEIALHCRSRVWTED